MPFHYSAIMRKYLNCPVAVAFGPSGAGKTTALQSGLAAVGADRFFRRGTKKKHFELCCESTNSIGIDDHSV